MKAPFFICVLISVLSRGIEPRPPPSEGDILSIKLREHSARRGSANTALSYYKGVERVNRGGGEQYGSHVEKKFFDPRQRERPPADGNNQKILRAKEQPSHDPNDDQEVIEPEQNQKWREKQYRPTGNDLIPSKVILQ